MSGSTVFLIVSGEKIVVTVVAVIAAICAQRELLPGVRPGARADMLDDDMLHD